MRKLIVLILCLGFLLFLLYDMNEPKIDISVDKNMEIDSLRADLQYYKEREKMFLKNNSELREKVSMLEQQIRTSPTPIYIKSIKNEKNPLVSTSESEYFNSILTRRYQDKP